MKKSPPLNDGDPVEAPVPWFVRAAQDMAGKEEIAEAPNAREQPGLAPQLVRWQRIPPTSNAAAQIPQSEPEVDHDGVLQMRWPFASEPPTAKFYDEQLVLGESPSAATETAALSAPGHTRGLVIACLALVVALGLTVLAGRQFGGGTTEVSGPRPETLTQSAAVTVPPTAIRADPADLLPPAAPAAAHAAAPRTLKLRTQPSNEVLVATPPPLAAVRLPPRRLASAMRPMPDSAVIRTLPTRAAEAAAAASSIAPDAPKVPLALASEQAATDDEPVALVMAEEADEKFEPTAEQDPPRRGRTGLPQCKGFQVYRPSTACRVDAPR